MRFPKIQVAIDSYYVPKQTQATVAALKVADKKFALASVRRGGDSTVSFSVVSELFKSGNQKV